MKLHLLTLKFSGESAKFEAPFLSDYYRGALAHIRLSLILCVLLYASFASLDAQRMPEQKYTTTWLIRFVIVCPALLVTLLATFSKYFERYMQPLLAGVFILVGGGIICMMFIDTPHVPYTGLLLVFLWGYTLVRIRFLWASLAGWVLVVSYEIAAIWISPTPFAVLLNNNFFFISANVIGMLACYSIEFYARRDFFLTQQLELEREKVYKVNQELEERVEKRTADYLIVNRALEQEIADHKQVEGALRESESKYRFMTDNVADIIWTVDMNLNFTYISPSVQRFRGLTVEEAMSQKIDEVLTPTSLQYALKVLEEENKILMGNPDRIRDKLTIELEEYCKDGSTIWTENELKYLPDQDGKPIGIIGVTRDISARKRAEAALRQSEEKYRLVIENAKEAIIIAQDMRLVFANRSAVDMIEYSGDMLEAKAFIDFIHPDDRNMVVDHHIRRLKGEEVPFAYSFRILREDGTVKWVEFNTVVTQWKGKPATISFLNDITARKQAAEALRESEEYFKEITENSSDVIIITDKNGDIKYCSRSIERFSGYKPEELIGKSGFTFIHPDDIERAVDDFGKAILITDSAIPNEFRVVRKDGSIRYFDGLGKNLLDNPAVAGFIMNIRDITERKSAEEEKRILEERLQRAHKMEAIGTLAGGIAHDFNNLLMGIQGYASLALLNINKNDPNYEKLKRIQEQVQSGADLTRQLLGFARGGRYEVKPADINDVIQKTSSMFGRTKKEIAIHKKFKKNLYVVEIDRGQMEQVFMNLYVNAWQAMPGGGNIYLETENVSLNDEQALSYSVKPGKYVKITVTDTGTGMDEKTRQRIFDPFFTTKEMGRGTGLGMAMVYGIINGHKGMINVYSEPGHGTTFTIYLPASKKEMVKEETATGTIDRGTETILLVDDEKIILEANGELLESMGYRVYAVGSGQEAIALFMKKRNKIDLVILDMIMPGISGGETFDRLREINPGIKVLLSSGYSLNGEAQAIMDRGCKGFIQKPFQIEKLSQKVREMLD